MNITPYCAFEPVAPHPSALPFAATWLFILTVVGVFFYWATEVAHHEAITEQSLKDVKATLEGMRGLEQKITEMDTVLKDTVGGLEQKITEMDTRLKETVAHNHAQITELKNIVSILAGEQLVQLNMRCGLSFKGMNIRAPGGEPATEHDRQLADIVRATGNTRIALKEFLSKC